MIPGTFTIQGDLDGRWYEVTFKPDRPREHGLLNAKVFGARFTADNMEAFYELVGKGADLVKAREPSGLVCSGMVSEAEFAKYAAE